MRDFQVATGESEKRVGGGPLAIRFIHCCDLCVYGLSQRPALPFVSIDSGSSIVVNNPPAYHSVQ